MIRDLRAFAWLRWKLLRNSLRPGKGRDLGERLSRVVQVLTPVFLFLLIVPSMIGLAFLGFIAGAGMADSADDARTILVIPRVILLTLMVMVMIWPLIRSAAGSSTNLTRLMLLPLSRRALHFNEMLSGISDPWLAVFVPGIFMLGIGLWAGGAGVAGLVALAAACGFTWVLLALASCSAFAIHLLLRNRRRAEMAILILAIVLSTAGIIPALVMDPNEMDDAPRSESGAPAEPGPRMESGEDAGSTPGGRRRGQHLKFGLPAWTLVLPSELHAKSVMIAVEGNALLALLPLAALFLQGGLTQGLSLLVYRRLLETPEGGGPSRRGMDGPVRTVSFPILGPTASAVAATQARTFLRTVKGKMAVYFGPIIGMLLGFMMWRNLEPLRRPDLPIGPGIILSGMMLAIFLLSLQPILLNLFATDGAGLTMQFLAPLSGRDLVVGKLAACAVLGGAPMAVCFVVAVSLLPAGSPYLWLTVPIAGVAAFAVVGPTAAILSAIFPRVADLNSLGSAGNPHTAAALLGTAATLFAVAIPAGLSVIAAFLLRKPWMAPLLVGVWCAIAAAVGWLLTRLAAGVVDERRENLALVAQGK